MTKEYVIGSTEQYNALSAERKAEISGHYESLRLFCAAFSGTSDTEPYLVTPIVEGYEEILNVKLVFNINLGSNRLVVEGIKFSDNVASGHGISIEDGKVEIGVNCELKTIVDKSTAYYSNIFCDDDGEILCSYMTFDMNNKNTIPVMCSNNAGTRNILYRCILINGVIGTRSGGIYAWNSSSVGAAGDHYIINCLFLDVENAAYSATEEYGAKFYSYNNYFKCYDTSIDADLSQITQYGGDTESSTISTGDAFVDYAGGDYTPTELLKIGVAPEIPEDESLAPYYTGVILPVAPTFGRLKTKIRKHRTRNLVLGY